MMMTLINVAYRPE